MDKKMENFEHFKAKKLLEKEKCTHFNHSKNQLVTSGDNALYLMGLEGDCVTRVSSLKSGVEFPQLFFPNQIDYKKQSMKIDQNWPIENVWSNIVWSTSYFLANPTEIITTWLECLTTPIKTHLTLNLPVSIYSDPYKIVFIGSTSIFWQTVKTTQTTL